MAKLMEGPMKMMLILIEETDTWGEERVPLFEALVETILHEGLSGATVHAGIMGFGQSKFMRRRRLFGVTDEKPVTITVIDGEDKIRAVLPRLREMVREGLIFLVDGEVAHVGTGKDDE